jgi:hypothetical protein
MPAPAEAEKVVCPKCGRRATPIRLVYEIETVRLNEAGEIVSDDTWRNDT